MGSPACTPVGTGAEVKLDGVLLIGLRGSDWNPGKRYALIRVAGDYEGSFSGYDLYGALPNGYEGVLDSHRG